MSFNTRSGRQAGRGPQQAQMTYHQTPRQPFQAQAFTQPQPAPPGSGALPPLQQQQQQQQQQTPQQFKMQQQPATPAQVKMEQVPPSPGGPPTPVVVTHQIPMQSQAQPQPALTQQAESSEVMEAKPWKKHKNPSFKVNKVQKRRRQNARFRKLLIPKNAIMVLNELQPGITFDADEQTNAFNQLSYTVRIEIDGVKYTGEGPSKAAAKAAAAELAVKGLILKKIADSSMKKDREGGEEELKDEAMDTASGDDMSDKGSTNGRRVIPEDEVPWGSLASFALFKLFADWKAQGSNIPPVGTPSLLKPIPKAAPPKPSQPVKGVMPENPETLHPVTLVGRLYPGTLFEEISREGSAPNFMFCMGATVNGTQYTGKAKSKKEAKKNCAINILKALNVTYNTTI